MDIDEQKKRKVEEPEKIDLDQVLKTFIETTTNVAKILAILAQKVDTLEKVFNKDLFKSQ